MNVLDRVEQQQIRTDLPTFQPGDTLKVEADGAGRVVLTRIDELIDRYSGRLETGGDLRERVEGLRGEWR